ncbi:MAG: lamin tail domain-containing protein [Candidatus Pacebacteria bacterium]|nr:lamin tail domain-containing protein [Candidatus Paceibacterota bacterium]MBP9866820.1 lamin tail domain-containing protein [Candidatus Paceibacterota bacterium]
MKKILFIITLLLSMNGYGDMLSINEIMSNPVGDDSGREWIELHNTSSSTVDISTLTISVKGGAFVGVVPLSGGTSIEPDGYAIIGSTVSGATKFSQDYSSYNGPLFRSSVSLVNTGVTSLEISLQGVSLDKISSYTAAKEGFTLSKVDGALVSTNPTPGAKNEPLVNDNTQESSSVSTSSVTTSTQSIISQAFIPTPDIVLYMDSEKIAVAGAGTTFSLFGLTRSGKYIDNMRYTWTFGDGGQSTGSSTEYHYAYPGTYIAVVEGSNGIVYGQGRMRVRVVAPDLVIRGIQTGKYGSYVDIENPNEYDLDLSGWRLVINGASYTFPKNTLIASKSVTHFPGIVMGFASTTPESVSSIKIVFPNQEEVTRYEKIEEKKDSGTFSTSTEKKQEAIVSSSSLEKINIKNNKNTFIVKKKEIVKEIKPVISVETKPTSTSPLVQKEIQKDTRLASFIKSLFWKK